MKIKIFLADDQYLMLEGIKAILKHEPEMEIVGTAQDGHSAITQVIELQPDLVLIDIEMPKINGIVATKYICKHVPDTRVIVLTSHKKQSYITEAMEAGASGYLLKDSLIQDLKQAIHASRTGYAYIETKLFTPIDERRKTINIIKYKKQIAYLKKYRKSIYIPGFKNKCRELGQNFSKILIRNSVNSGISKAILAPIFDLSKSQDILMLYQTKPRNKRFYSQPQINRQKYLRTIAFLLSAIASFILSIIAF